MAGPAAPGAHVLATFRAEFARLRAMAERALAQVDDAALHHAPDPESNSLAVIARHMAGNLRSRFTDFLTSDGEKPWRDRDGEFEARAALSRAELLAEWEAGWGCLAGALDALAPDDLARAVVIRGESLTVCEALARQLSHHGQHTGQIVWLAKHLAGPRWKTLSIPRGQSKAGAYRYKP
jgi:hypothetical protein